MSLEALRQAVGQILSLPHGEIVIVYEGFASGLKAKQLFDQLITPWDPDTKHRFKMWDFSGLRIDALRVRAIEDAVMADIVCISLEATTELPAAVRDWAEKWANYSAPQHRTLVALLEPTDDLFADQTPLIALLRDIAQRADAKFLIIRAETVASQQKTYSQEPLYCV